MTTLNVFSLNRDLDTRHTNLTRARGEAPDLPPLNEWLGVEKLDTDDIEMFPVGDLADMTLSDYITAAFAPEDDIPRAERARLNALDGWVLLIPDDAVDRTPEPGAEAVLVAELPLARPDHRADMAPVSVTPPPRPAADPVDPRDRLARRGSAIWILLAVLAIAVLVWIVT